MRWPKYRAMWLLVAFVLTGSLLVASTPARAASAPAGRRDATLAGAVALGTQTLEAGNDSNGAGLAEAFQATAARANSLVYGVGEDWDNDVARVPDAGQALVSQWVDAAQGDTFWTQAVNQPEAAPGIVALGDSAPTADRWNLAAVEITTA